MNIQNNTDVNQKKWIRSIELACIVGYVTIPLLVAPFVVYEHYVKEQARREEIVLKEFCSNPLTYITTSPAKMEELYKKTRESVMKYNFQCDELAGSPF